MKMEAMELSAVFSFNCIACGRCCKYIQGVPLKSYDLFKIARLLNQSPIETLTSTFDLVDALFMPMPTLKTDRYGYCILLKDHLCSVHAYKPFVCRLFPIQQERQNGKYQYSFIPDCYEPCGTGQKHVLGQWLDDVGETEILYAALFSDLYSELGNMLLDAFHPGDRMDALGEFLFHTIFLNYDIGMDYEPQFHANAEQAIQHTQKVLGCRSVE